MMSKFMEVVFLITSFTCGLTSVISMFLGMMDRAAFLMATAAFTMICYHHGVFMDEEDEE